MAGLTGKMTSNMRDPSEFLWYIPNDVKAGHRGDVAAEGHNNLDALTTQASH